MQIIVERIFGNSAFNFRDISLFPNDLACLRRSLLKVLCYALNVATRRVFAKTPKVQRDEDPKGIDVFTTTFSVFLKHPQKGGIRDVHLALSSSAAWGRLSALVEYRCQWIGQ